MLQLVDAGSSLALAAEVFSSSTLLVGLTGIPLGTAVAGGAAIAELEESGIPPTWRRSPLCCCERARPGTRWPWEVGLRLLVEIGWGLCRPPSSVNHFERIADQYQDQIPEHVRQRLLLRRHRSCTAT